MAAGVEDIETPFRPGEPGFARIGPDTPASPVVLSVPHAGRDYAPELLRASRLSQRQLETLEDRFVDRLIWRALGTGAVAIVARRPRAEIDLNRDEREIDTAIVAPPLPAGALVQSARTRGGRGLIPARITGAGGIWRLRTADGPARARPPAPYDRAGGPRRCGARPRCRRSGVARCRRRR